MNEAAPEAGDNDVVGHVEQDDALDAPPELGEDPVEQLGLAEENHRLVATQYEQGLATSLDLQDATSTLSQAR